MKAVAECSNKHIKGEPPAYKLVGETKTNPILLQEIESSYVNFHTDSNSATRQHSLDLR